MERSGLVTATVGVIAQGEEKSAASQAGTLSEPALKRFGSFNGSVQRNGAALGNLVSAEITYANNLDRVETIESGVLRARVLSLKAESPKGGGRRCGPGDGRRR